MVRTRDQRSGVIPGIIPGSFLVYSNAPEAAASPARPAPPAIWRCRKARAELQLRFTVAVDTPSTSAVSSTDRPPKKRRLHQSRLIGDRALTASGAHCRAPAYPAAGVPQSPWCLRAGLSRPPNRAAPRRACANSPPGCAASASRRRPENGRGFPSPRADPPDEGRLHEPARSAEECGPRARGENRIARGDAAFVMDGGEAVHDMPAPAYTSRYFAVIAHY